MKVEIARAGTALVDGKPWPARKLEDGTIQRSNRSNHRKGKWLDITDEVATNRVSFEWVDGAADLAEASAALSRPRPDYDREADELEPRFTEISGEDEDEVEVEDTSDEDEVEDSPAQPADVPAKIAPYFARVYDRTDAQAYFARKGDRFTELPLSADSKSWFENRELLTAWGERTIVVEDEETGEETEVTDLKRRLTVARADIHDNTTGEVVATFDPRIAAKERLVARRALAAQRAAEALKTKQDEDTPADDATTEDADVDG